MEERTAAQEATVKSEEIREVMWRKGRRESKESVIDNNQETSSPCWGQMSSYLLCSTAWTSLVSSWALLTVPMLTRNREGNECCKLPAVSTDYCSAPYALFNMEHLYPFSMYKTNKLTINKWPHNCKFTVGKVIFLYSEILLLDKQHVESFRLLSQLKVKSFNCSTIRNYSLTAAKSSQ